MPLCFPHHVRSNVYKTCAKQLPMCFHVNCLCNKHAPPTPWSRCHRYNSDHQVHTTAKRTDTSMPNTVSVCKSITATETHTQCKW